MNDNPCYEDGVCAAQNGNKAAMNDLIASLIPTVESVASLYVGRCPLSRSDLIQEGMIGLLSSIYGYDATKGAGFATYATVCITHSVENAVRNQLRKKHKPLNGYVPIDEIDIFDTCNDPLVLIDMYDRIDCIYQRIENELSYLEREVLKLHIEGHSYNYIAEKLSISAKGVDNALQRARKKLKEK